MRILYVDDDRINILLFEAACELAGGIECLSGESHEAALQLAARWTAQLLVIDLHLRGANGIELLRCLRELPACAHTPAVLCSADSSPGLQAQALAGGFVACWQKPVDGARLRANLRALQPVPATSPG